MELLLRQKRLDLIYKYLYAKNLDSPFFAEQYAESIRAFNDFHEVSPSDGIPKHGREAFTAAFRSLFDSMKQDGFDPRRGALPVGKKGDISDGAHRLACAAVLGLDVYTYPDEDEYLYDYRFFQERGISQSLADFGALEYVKLNPHAHIVNLHSVTGTEKDEQVLKILNSYGFVYYMKEINISFNGYVNLKKLSYGSFWEREGWIGTPENHFIGAQGHARASMGTSPMRIFVFVCGSLENVIRAEAEIRELYQLGNYSVHINDTHTEAVWLAETYFNENSLHMLNHRPFAYENQHFDEMVEELRETAKESGVNLDDICGAGSTPLDIYGVRTSQDLDFLYCGDMDFNIQTGTLSNHDSQLVYYPASKAEIIRDPRFHLYYHGVKFISLQTLYLMKTKRNEVPKDVRDCKLIRSIGKRSFFKGVRLFHKKKDAERAYVTLFGFIRFSYKRRKNRRQAKNSAATESSQK